ncbi:NADH dehydrogenase [ubiquinone] 1 alpha subcomplex assembly factor 5 [Phlyctochytrium bullatum]|nr:NADH dehydrogenase [ubiquinone] 1 alpha subcomplex assembly factor 5 [Phlyctochytrium bullatum]
MRGLASSTGTGVQVVFDRSIKVQQRNRAAMLPDSRVVDYLRDEAAARLVDRFVQKDIKRRFPRVLDLGAGAGHIYKAVDKDMMDHVVQLDSADKMLYRDADFKNESGVTTERIVGDEEFLPFDENTFDCVVSSMSMHWINDLPGAFVQVKRCLKPDAPFVASIIGGETLYELRSSLQLAEIDREGGVSAHISPMTSVRDVGSLLTRAGFSLLTVDVDEIVVNYPSMFELMRDLQAMGESNALLGRYFEKHVQRLMVQAENNFERHILSSE